MAGHPGGGGGVARGAAEGGAAGSAAGPFGAIIGAGLGALGGFLDKRQATKIRRRTRKAIASARAFAEKRVGEITGEGTLFGLATNFIRGTFEGGVDSPLARDFAKSIRSAQASRGLFSAGRLAAVQEGLGQSVAAQRLKTQLLPFSDRFGEVGQERLRQQITGFEAPLNIQAAIGPGPQGTFGPNILSSAVAGAAGGFQIGQSLSDSFQTAQEQDAQREEIRREERRRAQSNRIGAGVLAAGGGGTQGRLDRFLANQRGSLAAF